MKTLNIYKPVSVTPFELIHSIKLAFPKISKEKIGYAGRLDPMARGVMIYLIGEENKERKKYEKLTKIYKTKIVFGMSTDTYDQMGILVKVSLKKLDINNIRNISHKHISNLNGMIIQKYPPYSSAMVEGKRLYKHARENNLDNIQIPSKEIFIYEAEISNFKLIKFNKLRSIFINNIENTKGDFRQDEIIKQYEYLANINLITAVAYFEVSSGTYIRSIVYELGLETKTGAIAYDIFRIKAGDFKVEDSIKIM